MGLFLKGAVSVTVLYRKGKIPSEMSKTEQKESFHQQCLHLFSIIGAAIQLMAVGSNLVENIFDCN